MTSAPDRPTRFAADLLDAATVEGARQSRSAKQQLDHWARVGRAVTAQTSAAGRRIEAVFAGLVPMDSLSPAESTVLNAEITARVDERIAAVNSSELLRAQGVTTVVLDEDGNLVEQHPDGTTVTLSQQDA
jgi:hypothetical protein